MEDEIELEHSTLCQKIERDGRSVQVEIFRGKDRNEDWLLEVVDAAWMSSFIEPVTEQPSDSRATIHAISIQVTPRGANPSQDRNPNRNVHDLIR